MPTPCLPVDSQNDPLADGDLVILVARVSNVRTEADGTDNCKFTVVDPLTKQDTRSTAHGKTSYANPASLPLGRLGIGSLYDPEKRSMSEADQNRADGEQKHAPETQTIAAGDVGKIEDVLGDVKDTTSQTGKQSHSHSHSHSHDKKN